MDRSWHRARGTKSKAKPVTPVPGPIPLQTRRVLRVVHIVFVRVVHPLSLSSLATFHLPPFSVFLTLLRTLVPFLVSFLVLLPSRFDTRQAQGSSYSPLSHIPSLFPRVLPSSSRLRLASFLRSAHLLLPPSGRPSRRTLAGQPQSSSARLPSSRGPATPTATRSSCTRARGAQRLEEVQEDSRRSGYHCGRHRSNRAFTRQTDRSRGTIETSFLSIDDRQQFYRLALPKRPIVWWYSRWFLFIGPIVAYK